MKNSKRKGPGRSGVGLPGAFLMLAALLLPAPGMRGEQPAQPTAQIPLRSLGFPGYSVALFHAGASMATIHMLDSTHALFTYSLRSLVPRVEGDDANDLDREVKAELLEIPSGKVLSQTVWHLHDHARYLWNVGQGVFVLRVGENLSVFAPLRALDAKTDPFRRYALPHRRGKTTLVSGSPDGRLMTVEMATEQQTLGDEEPGGHRRHYTLEFFRVESTRPVEQPIQIDASGVIGSPVLLQMAMDGDGYLWAENGQRGKWTVSFNEFGGKQQKLASVLSSCHPRLSLLSRSQFLVESCRGSELSPVLSAYAFDGHENWEEHLGDSLQPPTLSLAPAAGRFALSRLSALATGGASSTLSGDDPILQEIRVYQTESGDMLLHVQSLPAVRSAENFDLSPDGRTLAVLGPETLDLYALPALSEKDRKDLAEVAEMTPPVGNGPVGFAHITRPVAAPESVGGGDTVHARDEAPAMGATAAAGRVPTAGEAARTPTTGDSVTAPSTAVASGDSLGDASPAEGHRRPPTLLEPGEKAEISVKAKRPE